MARQKEPGLVPGEPLPDVLNTRQAGEYLQIAPETLRDWVRAGKLPGTRIGRRYRFLKADLEKLLAGRHKSS